MGILNGLNNLNAIWLVIIIAIGLCFITISVVLLLLEKVKRQTAEDFSQQDKTMIIGLVEERIDELTAKMDMFREDVESSVQAVFNKISTKIDDLKTTQGQNQPSKVDALVPVISNLTEHTEDISRKIDGIQKKMEQVEMKINLELQNKNG
ncbi:MAG: hypothetical protein PHE88_04995 [Elusimicrobia bacterium]|nr:hypothetical protein [Elusimicrobiota bacterium]